MSSIALAPLLTSDDPPPVEFIGPERRTPLLLLCDHASRMVPGRLADLGLRPEDLARHIGWDIGAAAVTAALAERFQATAVLSGFSRLVIDCNRKLSDPTLIPAVSDGTLVPSNQGLDEASRAQRLRELFQPYHDAIEWRLDRYADAGIAPAVVAIHSFTPVMNGMVRPWQVGILWDQDGRLALPLLERLSQVPGLVVGDNQPYTSRDGVDYTLPVHAERRGLPHVLIEIRQDLIVGAEGIERQAAILGEALGAALDLATGPADSKERHP